MGFRADLPTPRHDADRIMLDEAMGAVSPSALAHAIGYKLVERFGGERASLLADAIVGNVQNARRAAK